MTGTDDIREALARIECGLGGVTEVKLLVDYLRDLTWKAVKGLDGKPVELCRHCRMTRDDGHAVHCVAGAVR